MVNDLIRFAMERAVESFGNKGDGLFNAAGFSEAMCQLARVSTRMDGDMVRAVLAGRPDVKPLAGGSHYKLITEPA